MQRNTVPLTSEKIMQDAPYRACSRQTACVRQELRDDEDRVAYVHEKLHAVANAQDRDVVLLDIVVEPSRELRSI